MSEFTEKSYPSPAQTVFENVWRQEDNGLYLFRSGKHEVMALADLYPKLPLQAVIAPSRGTKGEKVRFHELPRSTRRKLHEVADAVGEKLLPYVDSDQDIITHIEGKGIIDHGHIVVGADKLSERGAIYTGVSLGEDAVRRTVELLRFSEKETDELNQRLAHLSVW